MNLSAQFRPGIPLFLNKMGQWNSAEPSIEPRDTVVHTLQASPNPMHPPVKMDSHPCCGDINYKGVFLSNPVPMYLVSPNKADFRLLDANEAFLASVRLNSEDIIGKPLFDIFPMNPQLLDNINHPTYRECLEQTLETRREVQFPPVFPYDLLQKDMGFEERYWSLRMKPVLCPNGEVQLIMVKIVDVTETVMAKRSTESQTLKAEDLAKRLVDINTELNHKSKSLLTANEKLNEINRKLEATGKAKEDFLANISHEMRTPLNAVIGFSELLEGDAELTSGQREYTRFILQSAQHLLGLINDLLDLAKMEAGKLALNPHKTNLTEVLTNTVALFAPKCEEKGIDLQCSVSPELPSTIYADELRLRQMLMNLLSNAVKFTTSGSISLLANVIRVTDTDCAFKIDVRDTGCGVAASDVETLFQRYEQVGGKENSLSVGTGLGLAITQEMVHLMGGSISVESKLGIGSTFSIVLSAPIVSEQVENPKEIVAARVVEEYSGTPILVVDDVEINRKVLRASLLRVGFKEIDEACDGLQALEMAKLKRYPLILMDIFMPRMGGIDSTRLIRETPLNGSSNIIAITASYLDESKKKELAHLFESLLSKPFRNEQLQKAIGSYFPFELSSQARPAPKRMKLLLVDDHAATRRLIFLSLRNLDMEIEEASSGPEAIEKLAQGDFDVVLMDRVMPEMDGFEAARRMKTNISRAPPIIIMSSDFSPEDHVTGEEVGVSCLMEKPVRRDALESAIAAAVEAKGTALP